MSNGINLLVDKREDVLLTPIRDWFKIFRFGAIGILFVIGVTSVILSILIGFSPLPKLRSEEQMAKSDLAAFNIDINKLAFINDRGDSIRKILAERSSYDKKINIVESKMKADVTLEKLSLNRKNYTFRFSSKNLMSLDELLSELSAITGKGRDFLRVYINNLFVDKEKKTFVLVVDLLTI